MPVIACPVCQTVLLRDAKTWRCAQGHCFDVAREGYVNLLPVQHKKSREPGDAGVMVQARRDFLAAGHYQPLREALVQTLEAFHPASLVDIGCGEGYYTDAMADVVPDVVGLDIARPAIQAAARRNKKPLWLVAGSAHLPLADASVAMVTSLFSPLPVDEMARVLEAGGHLLVITPGPDHLASIREVLFESVIPHQPEKFLALLAARFSLLSRQDIRFPLLLPQAALRQLLLMTPYGWRARADRRAALETRECMQAEAVFVMFLLEKTGIADHAPGPGAKPVAGVP